MKNLKQVTDSKFKVLKDTEKVVSKDTIKATKKGYKKNPKDRVEFTKNFNLQTKAYKQYIEAKLNYLNSQEYTDKEYKYEISDMKSFN